LRRRRSRDKPASPVPTRTKVLGSGTGWPPPLPLPVPPPDVPPPPVEPPPDVLPPEPPPPEPPPLVEPPVSVPGEPPPPPDEPGSGGFTGGGGVDAGAIDLVWLPPPQAPRVRPASTASMGRRRMGERLVTTPNRRRIHKRNLHANYTAEESSNGTTSQFASFWDPTRSGGVTERPRAATRGVIRPAVRRRTARAVTVRRVAIAAAVASCRCIAAGIQDRVPGTRPHRRFR
jgi:hypothetical protein